MRFNNRERVVKVQEWAIEAISAVGSVIGGYVGVRIALAKLEVTSRQHDRMIVSLDTVSQTIVHRMTIAEGDLNRMKDDIGTHNTGMRGDVHKHGSILTEHELRLSMLERFPKGTS